jgi:non-specific serine/threonine protein kinase
MRMPGQLAVAVPPNNLPLQLTSFVGREQALADLGRRLARTRLLTLTGAPGVGKTRLALELAERALETYADGAWLIELAPLADPALVPQAVGKVLGVREQAAQPLLSTLAEALRPLQLLLVQDNCEHLIEACAELAERLLRACPRLEIVATSREVLGIAGETAWPVPAMTVPVAQPTLAAVDLAALREGEAVQLFVDRACAAVPTFSLTSQNAEAVVQVCRRLDGIPLALELAAARVRVLSVEQLAARLDVAVGEAGVARTDERFRLLTDGNRAAPPRQQTLRAAVDWSYTLLPEAEQVLLRRLAVFAGGWTLGAAEAVCADDPSLPSGVAIATDDVLDLLVHLVNKSLVVAEAPGGRQRYRLLETLREYGWERLRQAGEEEVVRHRHLAWLRSLAEAALPHFRGPEDAAWLDRFEEEVDNVRAALAWSQHVPAEMESGLRLAGSLRQFWYRRGRLGEGRGWLEAALAAGGGSMSGQAQALGAAGLLALGQEDLERAEVLGRQCLTLFRQLKDRHGMGLASVLLGRIAHSRGDHEHAWALTEESLVLFRETGDRVWTAAALSGLGLLAQDRGDYAQATAFYEDTLALYRELTDRYGIGWTLHYLGLVAQASGDRARARSLLRESVTLRHQIGDAEGLAGCLEGLAAVARSEGDLLRTARLLAAADALREVNGTPVPVPEQAAHEACLAAARDALGEQRFAAAWAAGRALSVDEAVGEALGVREPAPAAAPPVRLVTAPSAGPLSRREVEVAALIAQGLTNRQIAEELVVSEWTVDTHVRHILTKLELRSRAQVAAWTIERGLASKGSGVGKS